MNCMKRVIPIVSLAAVLVTACDNNPRDLNAQDMQAIRAADSARIVDSMRLASDTAGLAEYQMMKEQQMMQGGAAGLAAGTAATTRRSSGTTARRSSASSGNGGTLNSESNNA